MAHQSNGETTGNGATPPAEGTVNTPGLSDLTGWDRERVRKLVAMGLPYVSRPASRGGEWAFDVGEVFAWARVNNVKVKPPPQRGFNAMEGIEQPFHAGAVFATLIAHYELPGIAARAMVEEGVPIATAYRAANLALLALAGRMGEQFREAGIEPWASQANPALWSRGAFAGINWPHLARKSGDPGWTPPAHEMGWVELSREERARCIAHGEALAEVRAVEEAREAKEARAP